MAEGGDDASNEKDSNHKVTEAFNVKWNDKRIFEELPNYFKEGLPNMAANFFKWSTYFGVTFYAGRLGPMS